MLTTNYISMERETGWNQFKGKETPSTVEIHESFFNKVSENSDVLEFGCAWGRVAFQLQKLGYNVTGFDLNKNAVDTARKSSKLYGNLGGYVKFDMANALDLPYHDESFDACIVQAFLTTIISPIDRIKVLSEAYRVLKKNGILYIADFGLNWKNLHYREMYRRDYVTTMELGTFIVKDDLRVSDDDLFTVHHYTRNELIDLVRDFSVENFNETIFTTFHGNRTKGYIVIARKI
jgi:ubiquinone/menaquinone biosynthesis C-methylase UbiE